jgi:outer membrane protein assembly factor BamB
MRQISLAISLFFLVSSSWLQAEDWPGWRGPRGDGTSIDTGFPIQWTATQNVVWKVAIPGRGHSSPIIWGDRVFLTSCLEGEAPGNEPCDRVLISLDRKSGQIHWKTVVEKAPLERIHTLNSYSSSTPATDGERVYVTFLNRDKLLVVCYDFDGKELWRKSPGPFKSQHGFCSPPVLYKGSVIVNGDHDGNGYLVSFDKKTGEVKWKIDRPNHTRSYCPPLIVEAAGKTQLVMTGSKCVCSYNPDDGSLIWTIDGPTEQFVASMVYHKNLLFLTAGFPTYHVMAIRPDGTGNVTKTHVQWHETKGAGYVPSPLAVNGLFFNVKDEGLATCRNAETGKLLWEERLGKHFSASPVFAENRLYFLDDEGKMTVVQADKNLEVLSKNSLNENCFASPAFSKGQIFIRGEKHLWCIGTQIK